jgi:hypothetical protein
VKAYTSRDLFDERLRYTGVREQMGQIRLDSEANEQVDIARTDAGRRTGDVVEGSPDDGFRVTDTHLLDPVLGTDGWSAVGLADDDDRVITAQLRLVRRDPDTLPHVVRTRGHTALTRALPGPVDLLRLPVPGHPAGATYAAAAIVVQVRFDRPPTDDELVDVRVVVIGTDGTETDVAAVPTPEPPDAVQASVPWTRVTLGIDALASLRAGAGADETLLLAGWGLRGLPPRAQVDVDALLAVDGALGEGDLVLRGGDGTVTGAGRLFVNGVRTFLEHDWRYSLQPDLPDPQPLVRPVPAAGEVADHHVVYVDLSEHVVRGFQAPRIVETALGGEESAARTRLVTQVRVRQVAAGESEALPGPTGGGRLTTNVAEGTLPDRFPAEERDPCRDRCLSTANASTGRGYRGSTNVHVRVEVLVAPTAAQPGVLGWSRDNAARVAPLVVAGVAGAEAVFVSPQDARSFSAGDLVVVEDERSRLDPERAEHRHDVRALRAVNSATGELELEPAGHTLTTDPVPLVVGGGLSRGFALADAAAVRRWDGVDHLLTGVRYNLVDGIDFALGGADFRVLEFWTFTARVAGPDSVAEGVVDQLTDAPVAGPRHERVPIARVTWTETGRAFEDLRVRFLPLHEVRDRLIELGARHLAPGAFTVVVGDGRRTFGDIDQDLAEGVTGDEALQAALDRLGAAGGAIYVRAGDYRLEHPVLVQGRSKVRVLGDGDASALQVTGAGGAFHVDACGVDGEISIELLSLAETPELQTPIGSEAARPVVPRPFGPVLPLPALPTARPVLLADLVSAVPSTPDLVAGFASTLRQAGRFGGRAAGSVVATLAQLRRLQRAEPGRPLEDVAPAELDVLRRLPHGVVTLTDSRRVRLAHLTLTSRETGQADGAVAAAVLVSGTCADVVVTDCRMHAPSGVVAVPYTRFLTPTALTLWPRSGLFLHGLAVRDCVLAATGEASYGVRVADGVVDGVVVAGNRIDGFARGIAVEDAAEVRAGEAVDRTVVRDNVVVGARVAGILVSGDGVDVDTNEVRLGGGAVPGGAGVRAGIQVTGVANRVRDCWVTLDPRPLPALAVQAGVLVGTGADDGGAVGRPVHDVLVTGNRVDGAGAQGIGVLVGGSTPCLGVHVRGNALRSLGDAGVRVWASSGAVGGVRVEDNTIEDVARLYLSWGPSVVEEVRALADVTPAATATPRDVLDALLATGGASVAAIDALLRWLERATLRGGVVVSLAQDSEVRGNRIREVGVTAYPAGFGRPGTEIRTGGVASVGARDLVVAGNQVSGVRTPVTLTRTPVRPLTPVRPRVLDVVPGLVRARTPGRVVDVFGPAVALRRQVMAYTAGDARARRRIGTQVYAAIESLAGALDAGGPESRRLAVELQGGLTEMLEAQGTAGHTRSANHVRATLSRAAALTAPDPAVAQAWDAAARFDSALVGEDGDVSTAAADVLTAAPELVAGLEGLRLDPEGVARTVLGAGGTAAERGRAQVALADTLGTLAEARGRKVEIERSAGSSALTATDRAAAEGIVQLSLAALDVPDPTALNEQAVERLATGGAGLTEVLRTVSSPLADRVATDLARLRAAGARPTAADVERLTSTLREVQSFARGEDVTHEVAARDLDAQQVRFHAELIAVTADQIERRVAGLDVDAESSASRNLALIEQASAQLASLVGTDPQARSTARAARAALHEALTDVEHRGEHQARARELLRGLAASQGLPTSPASPSAPATAPSPTPATGPGPEQSPDLAEPLAGLGGLVLALHDATQPVEVRREAGSLLENRLRAVVEGAGLGAGERAALLDDVPGVVLGAVEGSPVGRAAAVHGLAAKVEQVAYRAAQQDGAPDDVRAAHVLAGGLTRALDPALPEPERLAGLRGWMASRGEQLSTTLAGHVSAAADLTSALSGLRRGLDSLLDLPELVVVRVPTLDIDADAADGAYVAGATRRLEVSGNTLADCRVGLTVAGADGHALAPAADGEALVLTVEGNAVHAAALGAYELHATGAGVAVVSNTATGCCGVVDRTPAAYGQAVLSVRGSGDLLVADNRLRDNGNSRAESPVHEVLLDWDGDVAVRGNQVRHAGSAAGGHGVAVISGDVPADLVRRLVGTPALVVEPVSAAGPPVRPGFGVLTGLDDVLSAGLAHTRADLGGTSDVAVGGLRLATRQVRPSFTVLTAGVRTVPATDLAQTAADSWLEVASAPVTRPLVLGPLLDFLGRRRPPLILVRPPARRAVHVVGNVVVAAGPALVVLHEGSALVSATVLDNELESLGPVGALYLRGVDTTTVAANRLESQREVNVAVLRVRASLVAVTGNTLAGDEPAVPTTPPVVTPTGPLGASYGDLHLSVPVGTRASLMLRLDPGAVREAIDAKRSASFSDVTADAETSFGLFTRRTDLVLDPDVAGVLTRARDAGLAFRTRAGGIVADRVAAPGVAGAAGAAGVPGAAAPASTPAAERVERAVATTNAILSSTDLGAPAKLFGLATSSGMPAHQARSLVQSHLVRAGGDEAAALASGLAEITGIADVAGPTVAERVLRANPVEDLVSLLLRNRSFTPIEPARVLPVRRAPDPRRFSLVVVGGSRVGVTGNVTTAGVHVHDAAHSVENNV